jgi:hypothetical protein
VKHPVFCSKSVVLRRTYPVDLREVGHAEGEEGPEEEEGVEGGQAGQDAGEDPADGRLEEDVDGKRVAQEAEEGDDAQLNRNLM